MANINLPANQAKLSFAGQDNIQRNTFGVILKIETYGEYNTELSRTLITFVSNSNLLKKSRDTSIIFDLTVVEIIKQTCEQNDIESYQLQSDLAQFYPAQAFALQAVEAD
jgi:uncharacterized protein involved in type VI secretion and phage assembly